MHNLFMRALNFEAVKVKTLTVYCTWSSWSEKMLILGSRNIKGANNNRGRKSVVHFISFIDNNICMQVMLI
jgi:hypothetical protein